MAWSCLGGPNPEQLVYAWVMAHPSHPLPLVGSQHLDRVRHAINAEVVHLDRQQWFQILQAAAGQDAA